MAAPEAYKLQHSDASSLHLLVCVCAHIPSHNVFEAADSGRLGLQHRTHNLIGDEFSMPAHTMRKKGWLYFSPAQNACKPSEAVTLHSICHLNLDKRVKSEMRK